MNEQIHPANTSKHKKTTPIHPNKNPPKNKMNLKTKNKQQETTNTIDNWMSNVSE